MAGRARRGRPPGRVLRVKLGYNPNSSSVGSELPLFLGLALSAGALTVLTLHLGPEDILVNLNVNFEDGLDTDALEAAVDEIERRIREEVPAARRIFIEAESIKRIGPAGGS